MTLALPPIVAALGSALFGSVFYHIAAKTVPAGDSIFAMLTGAYLLAAGTSALIAFSFEGSHWAHFEMSVLRPQVMLLGAAILMIECGFLWAYRAGAAVGIASVLVNAALAAVLACVGIVAFNEHLSIRTIAGISAALMGTFLLASAPN